MEKKKSNSKADKPKQQKEVMDGLNMSFEQAMKRIANPPKEIRATKKQ